MPHIFVLHLEFFTVRTQTIRKEACVYYKFLNHFMEQKSIFISYLYIICISLNSVFQNTFLSRQLHVQS